MPPASPRNPEPTSVRNLSPAETYGSPSTVQRQADPGPKQIQQRQQERRRALRRVRLGTLLRVLGAAALVGVVLWGVAFSPLLAVREEKIVVVVQSGELDTAPAETKVLNAVGTPLIRVNTGGLTRQILEDPRVLDARVARSWPSGLLVELVQRKPVMAVQNGAEYDLTATDGVVTGTVATVPEEMVSVTVGSGKALGSTQIAQVLETWTAMPDELKQKVDTVTVAGTTLTLHLVEGQVVLWGDSTDEDLKAQVLLLLLAERPAQSYDVSTPTKPSTR